MDGSLENWLKKMKYSGEIPHNLDSVCNSSTSYIWDQLVANTKPRKEVECIRRNVIINRLKLKPLNNQNDFPFPIPEIEVYNRKLNLQDRVKHLKKVIEEKRAKVEKLAQNNKIKYVAVERSKAKVKENLERKYLLSRRCDILKVNISKSKDALSNVRSLTPIEVEENPNVEETTEILRQASEKITELLKKMPAKSEKKTCSRKFVSESARKPPSSAAFEQYLLRSDSKLKSVLSVRRENTFFGLNSLENCSNVKKCLFTSPNISMNETVKSRPRALFGKENVPKASVDFKREPKRESLGLLNNLCLNDSDPFFHLNSSTTSSALSALKEMDDNEFTLNDQNRLAVFENQDLSVQHHPMRAHDKFREVNADLMEILNENKILNELLLGLLHRHDRQFIFETVQNLEETLQMDILKHFSTTLPLSNPKVMRDDITKLRLTHIQIEMDIRKQNRLQKKIINLIKARKNSIVESLLKRDLPKEQVDLKLRLFEHQLKDIALDAVVSAMKKETLNSQNLKENNNLLVVSKKLIQVKQETATTIQDINHYIKMAQQLFMMIRRTRETTYAVVHTLMPFTSDLSWCSVLTENIWIKENETFDKFPLNYNRKFNHAVGDLSTHYRDVYENSFPLEAELDDDLLFILTEILEKPFSPPETIMLDILKAKMKLNIMQNIKTDINIPSYKTYSFEELQEQESYIQFAMDRLYSLLNSSSSQRTLSCVDVARKVMQIWLQMPFKNYIKPTRVVKGMDYKSYEKRYDSFYNNI